LSGFEAKIEEIRQTGEAAGRAADGVRGVNAASAWPGGEAGMPGSKAVGKLDRVREAWEQIQIGTASALDAHADSVKTTADLYASSDQAAQEALSPKEASSRGIKAV